MYRPPEALTSTADVKKTPSPLTTSSAPRARPTVRHKSPASSTRTQRRSEDRATPPAAHADAIPGPLAPTGHAAEQTPLAAPAAHERIPATFTRHGERIVPPPRRAPTDASRRSDMSGILSPKPVRTATGVWRPVPTLPLAGYDAEDDDDEDDEDDGGPVLSDVVQRSAHLAHEAWSLAVLGPTPKRSGDTLPYAPSNAPSNESDGEEDDFHKTMLHDPELDVLARVPSPWHDASDVGDGLLTDGHTTTPSSLTTDATPGDVPHTRSPSAKPSGAEATSDAVFQHALPLPRSAEAHTHAGALTLSLPYELCAAPHAAVTPPAAPVDELDADGDTPLTPVHTVTAQERSEWATGEGGVRAVSPAESLAAALVPGTLPSADAAPPALVADEPSSPFSCASPLFDDASTATSGSSPADATLHYSIATASKADDDDAYFLSPDEMITLTDLDSAWDSAHLRDTDAPRAAARSAAPPAASAAPAAVPTRAPAAKRRRCAVETHAAAPAPRTPAAARRVPRLRSRAS
ncbi:hypothetical protein MBRA1_000368 [Malassezia brasiliensis]|uniref:Uncharacterized protein n=1 Tax=Malassezia brasiliensis TaxID=1821822 RepID=A0AAF0DT86_9BASI|nr:hypothetical protein MBRA1_000368 [Malassezia brasiliensis]